MSLSLPTPKVALKNWYAGWPLDLWNYLVGLVAAILALLNMLAPPTARAVATNIPAYTGAGTGTLTGSVNGALPSQDGVATLAVGDVIIVPTGTITTGVIAAADSGPYQIAALGGASAKWVLTRPSWYAQGSFIPLAMRIKVDAEGTEFANTDWRTGPSNATQVVGTNDPQIMPEKVVVQVTLGSNTTSTALITTVPLRANGKVNVSCGSAVGGTPQAATVSYGTVHGTPPVVGGIGTASILVNALIAGQAVNGSADTSILDVMISQ